MQRRRAKFLLERKHGLFTLGFLFLLGCVAIWVWVPGRYPVQSVQVVGSHEHTSREQLLQMVTPYLKRGFFRVDVRDLRQHLLEWPWLSHVSVRRVWPETVRIELREYEPIARWNNTAVVDEKGHLIFAPLTEAEKHLPLLEGPQAQWVSVWEHYRPIQKEVHKIGREVSQLSLAPWGSWRIVLDNQLEIIVGKTDIEARLARFVDVFPFFEAQQANMAVVDLRYTGGFAVGWAK